MKATAILTGVWFVLSATMASYADEPIPLELKRTKIYIDRSPTLEESADPDVTIVLTSRERFLSQKFSGTQSFRHTAAVDEIRRHEESPWFVLEYVEDEDRNSYGKSTLSFPGASIPLSHTYTRQAFPAAVTPEPEHIPLEILRNKLRNAELGRSEHAAEVVLWTLTAPAESPELACEAPNGTLQFAEPGIRALHSEYGYSELSKIPHNDWDRGAKIAGAKLGRAGRFNLFAQTRSGNPCVAAVAKRVWSTLFEGEGTRGSLAWDFRAHLDAVMKEKHRIRFSGLIEAHEYGPGTEDLVAKMDYLQQLLIDLGPDGFVGSLPAKYLSSITEDINEPGVESRMQPIDILSLYVATHRLKDLTTETLHSFESRNAMALAAVQHVLHPNVHQPKVFIIRSHPEFDKQRGKTHFLLQCAGEKIISADGEPVKSAGTGLIDTVELTKSEVERMRRAKDSHFFKCGTSNGALSSPTDYLEIPLEDPKDGHFEVGEDGKIKAVATFQLVDKLNDSYFAQLKAGVILKGYRLVEETKVEDIRREFMDEMLEADLYFPSNHTYNGASFEIGRNDGKKLRMVRHIGKTKAELVLFVPGNQEALTVRMNDREVGELFERRRNLPVKRRLTVMNIKCNSGGNVTHWMSFYRCSFDTEVNRVQAQATANNLKCDVPVAIGAGRSFPTNDTDELVKHARYPFNAIWMAAEEKPFAELISYLDKEGYQPKTNMGNAAFFNIRDTNARLRLEFDSQTPHGPWGGQGLVKYEDPIGESTAEAR